MEDRPTTTSATTAPQGGIIYRNSIIYRNFAIYYITNNCQQCHPAEEHVVSEDTPSSSVHSTTSVTLVDCVGRELRLGDIVETEKMFFIYAGDRMIIGMDGKTGKIFLEPINVEEPFSSISSRKLSPTYSRKQIVQRAKGKVGQTYDDGPINFVFWCCTDMRVKKWEQYQEPFSTCQGIRITLISDD